MRKDKIIYKIPAPYSMVSDIEVYGDPDNGWYEYRIVTDGRIEQDSGSHKGYTQGMQYGCAEIALRDGLIFCAPPSNEPDGKEANANG
jgi:hypothetical protein